MEINRFRYRDFRKAWQYKTSFLNQVNLGRRNILIADAKIKGVNLSQIKLGFFPLFEELFLHNQVLKDLLRGHLWVQVKLWSLLASAMYWRF